MKTRRERRGTVPCIVGFDTSWRLVNFNHQNYHVLIRWEAEWTCRQLFRIVSVALLAELSMELFQASVNEEKKKQKMNDLFINSTCRLSRCFSCFLTSFHNERRFTCILQDISGLI
jgi:hypothetical protein